MDYFDWKLLTLTKKQHKLELFIEIIFLKFKDHNLVLTFGWLSGHYKPIYFRG